MFSAQSYLRFRIYVSDPAQTVTGTLKAQRALWMLSDWIALCRLLTYQMILRDVVERRSDRVLLKLTSWNFVEGPEEDNEP
jgi:hypothetical protein